MKPTPLQIDDKFFVNLSVRHSRVTDRYVICRHESGNSALGYSKHYDKILAYAINVSVTEDELKRIYEQSNFMQHQPISEANASDVIEKFKKLVPEGEITYVDSVSGEKRKGKQKDNDDIDYFTKPVRKTKRKFISEARSGDGLFEPQDELKNPNVEDQSEKKSRYQDDILPIMKSLLTEGKVKEEDMFTNVKQMNLLVFYEIEHYPNTQNLVMIKKFIPREGKIDAFLAPKSFELFKRELQYPTAVIDNKETYHIVTQDQIKDLKNPSLSYDNVTNVFYAELKKRLLEYWKHPLPVATSVKTQTEQVQKSPGDLFSRLIPLVPPKTTFPPEFAAFK